MLQAWINEVPSPSYVVDETVLLHNLEILRGIRERTGAKILLAQKAFSMYSLYPLIAEYLDGFAASGLYEARLAYEEGCGKENHVFSPAYTERDFPAILSFCDHLVFNSPLQWLKFRPLVLLSGKKAGLRINPEHSTQDHPIYDPCSPSSRLGIRLSDLKEASNGLPDFWNGLSGIHFHTLCEQGAEPLAETLEVVESKFGKYLEPLEWINFGGGHHITKEGYDISLLEKCISRMKEKYGLQVYLEPGEAVALNAGFLVATVIDVIGGSRDIPAAILDVSAACHMPDVLEMPYRPFALESGSKGEKAFTYILAGPTCLAGDVIGEYSFDVPLESGSKVVFTDMAIYTMVKNNTFNGMPLPSIMVIGRNGSVKEVKSFGYDEFKRRL